MALGLVVVFGVELGSLSRVRVEVRVEVSVEVRVEVRVVRVEVRMTLA